MSGLGVATQHRDPRCTHGEREAAAMERKSVDKWGMRPRWSCGAVGLVQLTVSFDWLPAGDFEDS